MQQHNVNFSQGNQQKLVWSTDLHLDAAEKVQNTGFIDLIKDQNPSALLIGGDICNGYNALMQLKNISKEITKPIYFVLGNHDFYYGSIHNIRKMAALLANEIPNLHYLSLGSVVELNPDTALIGHDGWSDARAGDFLNTTVVLNDYFLIDDLKDLTQLDRLHKLNELGTEACRQIEKSLIRALDTYSHIILLTHVPPFREACYNEGHPTDDNWAPHFVNKVTGDMLKKVMEQYPAKKLLILCGHSHEPVDIDITPNIRVLAGESHLGKPGIQGVIFID